MDNKPLYKYTSLENAKKIILSKKLKFTKPSEFNDPFDCNIERLEFDLTRTDEEFVNRQTRLKNEVFAEYGEKAHNVKWESIFKGVQMRKLQKARLCCFSLSNSHPLLWSHYGDKHTGACLFLTIQQKIDLLIEQ